MPFTECHSDFNIFLQYCNRIVFWNYDAYTSPDDGVQVALPAAEEKNQYAYHSTLI